MPLRIFEAACVVIVVATLVAMARRTPARALLTDYALLALAGWIGEESAISIYRFYRYDPAWDARVLDVPLLVPLIWPLVILSAREVAAGLFPTSAGVARAAVVGAIVVVDASLVEVVAVRAGLWSWAEGGHLGVPLIGILGWGYFALGAELSLSRFTALPARASVLVIAPAIAHLLLVVSWWALLKWTLRGALGTASLIGMVVIAVAVAVLVVQARRRGDAIPLEVAAPRTFAAALFFALLVSVAPTDLPLWLHVACVALPYLAATRWRPAAQPTR